MENQSLVEPIISSQQSTKTQTKDEVSPVQLIGSRPKSNNFLVWLLSILLFVSLSITAFFAFQTQKLVKELTVLKNTPTPVATIEPVATADPTASWKTYTNNQFNFSFNYPDMLKLDNFHDGNILNSRTILFGFEFRDSATELAKYPFTIYKNNNLSIDAWVKDNLNGFVPENVIFVEKNKINNNEVYLYQYTIPDPMNTVAKMIIFKNQSRIFILSNVLEKDETLVNQILSTFKFTN